MSVIGVVGAKSHHDGGVKINIGGAAGLVVGAGVGYKLADKAVNNTLAVIVTDGIGSQVGGGLGRFAANHMSRTVSAGLAVKFAENLGPTAGLSGLLKDGVAATAGEHLKDVPEYLQKLVSSVAQTNPKLVEPGKIINQAIEGAPGMLGEVVGSGWGVQKAQGFRNFAPKAVAVGAAIAGVVIGAHLIGHHVVFGGSDK